MKLYKNVHISGQVIELRLVEDAVVLVAPFVQASQEELDTYLIQNPPAPLVPEFRSQETDVILQRLTDTERAALFIARRNVWQLDYMLTRATSTGRISEEDPDFPAGKQLLADLGVILPERWDQLFA